MKKLFEDFTARELVRPLACFGARRVRAGAGDVLVHEGDPATHFGLILTGAVNIVRYTPDGRERLLAHLSAGEAFGTSFVLGGADRYFATITAAEPSEIVFLNGQRVLSPCSAHCTTHVTILTRLLATVAHRNSRLAQKIDCLSQRSTAAKLMAYLRQQATDQNRRSFDIPFTRQQLADYLNVNRAALCTEITKLEKQGKLITDRKRFTLP